MVFAWAVTWTWPSLDLFFQNLDVDDYEAIKIGTEGNMKTVLVGNDGTVLSKADTPSVLECDVFQYFWLDWRSNYMVLGEGS